MKTPRVEDFDPTSGPKLKSSLDGMPAIAKPSPQVPIPSQNSHIAEPHPDNEPASSPDVRQIEEPAISPPATPPVRTPVRLKRTITRYAFEFFQDQVTTLQAYSLEEKIRGETGSMSKMIREAVDAYLAKRKAIEE